MATPEVIALNEEYSRAVELKYQQETSQLYGAVRTGEQAAESSFENYIGTIDFAPIVTANGDTILQDVDHTRRRIVVHREGAAVPLDDEYDLHAVTDLGGPYMQALYAGAGRLVDQTIYKAFTDAALTGKTGTTSVNYYDAGECRLVEGSGVLVTAGSQWSNTTATALTVAKLNILSALFTNAHVPSVDRHLLLNEYNARTLMSDSALGVEERILLRNIKEGDVRRVLGFDLHVMADDFFTVNATDTACIQCWAWQRDAIIFKRGSGRKMPRVLIQPRPDKNQMVQFFADMYVGAARLRGPGIIGILLSQSGST